MLLSCSSNNSPTINIQTPLNGSVFEPGDTITINGLATDDKAVLGIILHIESDVSPNQEHEVDISLASNLEELYFHLELSLATDSSPGKYKLILVASDEEGEQGDDSVEIFVN